MTAAWFIYEVSLGPHCIDAYFLRNLMPLTIIWVSIRIWQQITDGGQVDVIEVYDRWYQARGPSYLLLSGLRHGNTVCDSCSDVAIHPYDGWGSTRRLG